MKVKLLFEVSYGDHIPNIVPFFLVLWVASFFLKLRGKKKTIAKKAVVDISKINLSMERHLSKKKSTR